MRRCLDYARALKDGELIKILSAMLDGEVAEEGDIAAFFPPRPRNTHKGSYGSACLVAGSEKYPGACALSIAAALRSGCGYVYAAVPQSFKYALAAVYPQCIYRDEPFIEASAIAFGMGKGCDERTYAQLCELLKNYKGKLIIDADGLNALSVYGVQALNDTCAEVLLTPHVGEMARLCKLTAEEVLKDPVGTAYGFAEKYNVTVHLKSAFSVTCGSGGKKVISVRGTTALAKAGSGDMLSGFICGSAARGLSLFDAAVCAQYVIGAAAELCSQAMTDYAVTAEEIIKNIPNVLKRLTECGKPC